MKDPTWKFWWYDCLQW